MFKIHPLRYNREPSNWTQATADFQSAAQELRDTIHDYLESVRDRVAALAVVIANESDSKAAD